MVVCIRMCGRTFNLLALSPSHTGLHIQTDTDWQTVLRPSEMFETTLANAYLVNNVRNVCMYERMHVQEIR